MGLLRGFKAKLIGRKREKPAQVVGVSISHFTEFEDDKVFLPSTSNINIPIHRNEVIKHRQPQVKPEIQNLFEKVTTVIPTPVVRQQSNVKKVEAPKPPPRLLIPPIKIEEIDVNNNQKITPDEKDRFEEMYVSEKMEEVEKEDQTDFKIYFSSSRDKEEMSEEDNSSDVTVVAGSPLMYSSQATSIFFGGDTDEIQDVSRNRPRNFTIGDEDSDVSDDDNENEGTQNLIIGDEDSDGSSASA